QNDIDVRQSDLLGILNDRDTMTGNVVAVKPPVDIVVANILAEIILLFTADVMEVLKPGGIYIASGIYKNKEEDVEAGLRAAGFEIVDVVRQDDWIAFVAGKPKEDEERA
ncbi:MAG: ribosomal protein methyltransferase, partial [Cohnella sp.]|nr:ribosomal protein methyltransferase [Cohnella sp.]